MKSDENSYKSLHTINVIYLVFFLLSPYNSTWYILMEIQKNY